MTFLRIFKGMLRTGFYNYGCRSFSKSSIWRDLKEVKPNQVSKPNEPATSFSSQGNIMDFKPSEFEKKVLLWSGKYKSKESIPIEISQSTLENAKSRLRIRIANILILCSLALSGVYIYIGKQRQKVGDTISKRRLEKDAEIIAESRKGVKN